jgi:hypothetical protein
MSLQKAVYGFVPTSITGCQMWLDGADTSSFTLSGSSVTQWRDKSGSNNNATPYSTSPQRVGDSVLFSGGNALKCGAFLTSTNCSVFIVNNYISGLIAFGCWKVQYGSAVIFQEGSIRVGVNNTSAYAVDASTSIANYTSNRIYGLTLNSSSTPGSAFTFNGSIDGSNVTITGTSTSGNASTCAQEVTIGGIMENGGALYGLNGYVYEVIVYNIVLTSTQRQQVEGYLAQKWGLTSSLPASHPGRSTTLYRSDYTKQNVMTARPYFTAFSPRQIPGCQLWLDGADPAGNGVIPANGATVSTWVDKSGNSKNGTQVNNPTYDLASKAIYFSGSLQYYTLPDSTFPIGNTSYSYFIIANFTSLGTGSGTSIWAGVLGGGGFTPSTSIAFRTNGAGGGFYEYWYANDIFSSTTYATNQIVAIESFYTSGGQRSLIQNFSVTTTNTPSTPRNQSAGNNVIGRTFSNEYMMGYIHEVIVYNSALGTTERQQIESYLAQKWGLTASLPGGHSHATQPAGAITRTALANLRLVVQPRRYTSFRWTITAGTTDGLIQFSEFQVGFNNTQLVFASPTTATTGSTISWNTGAGEGPAQAVDNNINTKGLGIGTSGLVLIVTVATPIAANMYRWATANDVTPGRNPTQWTVDGSADGTTFVRLHTQNTAYSTPSSTFTYTSWIPFTYS